MSTLFSSASSLPPQRASSASAGLALRFRPSIAVEQVRMNWTLVEQHFKAIQARDADAILAAYAPDCRVEHPLIGHMSKEQFARALRTFMGQTPDYRLDFQINHAGAHQVEAEWTLEHQFHLTGRRIQLCGTTTYVLAANSISRQIDRFDRRVWSRQALGFTGLVLAYVPGWGHFIERELRQALGIADQ
jgi:SnoaL-like domain